MDDATRKLLLDNPALFIVTYFSHAIEKLEGFHLELIEAATEKRRSLVLYPAGHGKTTIVSTLLPIWAICRDPNVRILVIGKNDQEATAIMTVIQDELENNEQLIKDFGPFRPPQESRKPWALGKLSVAGRTRRHKTPTLLVCGPRSKISLGTRTDWTICDDIVTGENSSTPEQRQKTSDWFNLQVATTPEHFNSRLTVVGTRFDPADLYADLQQLDDPENGVQIYHVREIDAIVDYDKHEALWPWRWPWKRLMIEKATIGTLSFNKRYRNIAVDESRMVFKEEFIKGGYLNGEKYLGCLDKNHRIGDYEETWRKMAGFDPAVGSSKHAKFCAHQILAAGSCRDHERCYWVVDMSRDQLSLPQQVDAVLEKHLEYGLQQSQVEANSYQAGLFQAIEQKMKERGLALSIQPHYTNKQNKPDPELGVQSMAPWFERGQVHIPWGDTFSRNRMSTFVDELVMYPGRTTDTVMAFWFAWRALEITGPRYGAVNRLSRQSPRLAKSIGRRVVRNPAYVSREAA